MNELPHTTRLQAAERIRAIREAEGSFPAADAETIAHLLGDMPLSRGSAVEFHSDAQARKWALGAAEVRCGTYVVTRPSRRSFEIRYAGDVHAGTEPGDLMRLRHERDGWHAYLNRPRKLVFGSLAITLGNRFIHWKRAR